MDKADFFKKLVDELDLDDNQLNEKSGLNLTSLNHLSLISFLDEYFGIRVKAVDLKNIDSIEKLMKLIGMEKFN